MVKTRRSLAVKYRPTMFEQFIGQDDVVNLLKGQFRSESGINRTFIITGVTGTGKTTLARMIAHYANCEHFDHETCEPCWECEYCKAVDKGFYHDVEEINFSETTGIETVRTLIESVRYEAQHNVRVYILDEIQGMSKQAQNALLKLLEEPPDHVLILLLTTDPQKIIDTIKNRCCPLNLQAVGDRDLIGFLKRIAHEEKKTFLKDAIFRRIALNAKGRVRQAVAALEAIIYTVEGNESFDQNNTKRVDEIIGRFIETPECDFSHYLIEGVYQGKYAGSLQSALRLVSSYSSPVHMANLLVDYHLQTLFIMVDPKQSFAGLTDPGYANWYYTLKEMAEHNELMITHQAAVEMADVLVDMQQKIGTYLFDVRQLVVLTTLKLLDIVNKYKDSANSEGSLFHRIIQGERH
jgi:DNA polymerase III subunit gamma/tau